MLNWLLIDWLFSGKVVNYEHAIPRGGLFEYVSCPHYLMEIVIYLAFLLIGGPRHLTLLSVVVFVITNQLVAGYLTHRWYRTHFGTLYPLQRKAVVPFLLWRLCFYICSFLACYSFLNLNVLSFISPSQIFHVQL